MKRRVVITGVGIASPLGASDEEFAVAILRGRSAVKPISTFDARTFSASVAAETPLAEEDIERIAAAAGLDPVAVRIDRKLAFGALAARRAMASAFGDAAPRDIALFVGMGLEVLFLSDVAKLFDSVARDIDVRNLPIVGRGNPLRLSLAASVRALVAATQIDGPVTTIVSACASGTASIGEAALRIANGGTQRALAGATDSMVNPMGVGCFQLLGALSSRRDESACRPFHCDRDGTVIGEGAAFFVLEAHANAKARGARIVAEILGYGASMDAHRVTAPDPEGHGARLSIRRAFLSAGRPRVGYVNAHGTGTRLNDAVEVAAIHAEVGDVPIGASKSAFGHAMAAAGALEIAATLLCFTHGQCAPTLHLDAVDPECAANHVTEARRFQGDAALKNSFGFGGQNATLILGPPP